MEFNTKNYDCALCNNNNTKQLLVKQGFSIVQCSNCSFVYVNPRLEDEQLATIYEHNYFKNKDYGYVGYEQEKRLRIRNFEKWLNDAEGFLSANALVNALDVGCAAGYCLDVMEARGWHSEGLELDEDICENLKKAGKIACHSSLENFKTKRKYQVITLFDVIEHIPNIDGAFKKLNNLLDVNGIIIMVTPNHDSLQRRAFGKKWFQYKPIEHIQYFTIRGLNVFAKRNNLQIVHHAKCGQYADTDFLTNRLKYYRFSFLQKIFDRALKLVNLSNRFFYVDTGSLLVIFKKT
jgi:2-polyprenyl-3-methyl-5-hydroxy-6-metoxy-1,4-benzoquinol methylase